MAHHVVQVGSVPVRRNRVLGVDPMRWLSVKDKAELAEAEELWKVQARGASA